MQALPEERTHPTQKPVPVMRWCLEQAKVPLDGTVLDPFMGSGTTAVACIETGRHFLGYEISPEYHAVSEKRIAEARLQPRLFAPEQKAPETLRIPFLV